MSSTVNSPAPVRSQRRKLPLWATLLCGLVVASIVTGISAVFGVFFFAQRLAVLCQKPDYITEVSARICALSPQLPAKWKKLLAADIPLLGISTVTFEHQGDNQEVVLMQSLGQSNDQPKEILSKAYSLGINTMTLSAKFQEMKSQGELNIGGRKMPYIVGRFIERSGRSIDGLVGCIAVPDQRKNILIYAYPAGNSPYNQEESVEVLKSIERF